MRYITDEKEKTVVDKFLDEAKATALRSTCLQAKCGAIIVKDGQIIGRGFNSPPADDEKERRCNSKKEEYNIKVTDKTCCVHAEERAVMNALRNHPDKIFDSVMYFCRFYADGQRRLVGENGGKVQLYCTICTKMMYDVGIKEFVLLHVKGIGVYTKDEYLTRSFGYGKYSID